ncbi:MAG: DUF465 domain-containing protein [Pseudomonadota bacterium]
MKTSLDEQQQLEQALVTCKQMHRELDLRIDRLIEEREANQFEISRLKKEKLLLKDKISKLESKLIPDLLA